jgi:putative flippase GtrA
MEWVRQDFASADPGRRMPRELLRYLGVGLVNMAVGLSCIYLCMYLLHMSDPMANLTGYCAGIVCSFVLNRRWTFASTGPWLPQLLRFIAVLAVAYLANLATVLGAESLFGINRYIGQALGTVPYTAIGYLGSRLFAFRRDSAAAAVSY